MLKTTIAAEQIACLIVEPLQGEGGFVVPSAKYMQGLQKICNDNNVDIIDTDFGANVTIKLAAEMSVCDTFEKKLMDTFAGNVVLNDKENVKFCRNMAGNIIFL